MNQRVVDVAQSMSDVDAISDLGQRALRDVEKMQARAAIAPRKSFNDIRRDGIRGSPQLTSKFEAFCRRKPRRCQAMERDEKIVCPLPGDEGVVALVVHT